ncbi:hypothetical protein [Lyngbya sp. PCC 8106]|uniref:hypothetical protein n=1 Tax=Lyngbya sp. (strain PCC 8106) TaxID=313612 RepID=UPI0000EA9EDE|nr:hypothetical protein [Lyngbya sp. PCC 8106]EAW39023.1 hypothetical protein L8106_01872 [Lyngbya sp. PCC 8106]
MTQSFTDSAVKAATAAVESEAATVAEKVQMLSEISRGLLQKPKGIEQIEAAVLLYRQAIELCGTEYPLLKARATVGLGIALRTYPGESSDGLVAAKKVFETALPILQQQASPEEVAELQMNLGLVFQALVPFNLAQTKDAVQAYQQALEVFTPKEYPQEYAILHNNIAIAYLSMSMSGDGEDMRQALAVQSFEEALNWIILTDHPSEYAMLQNNLGNALQYLPSVHPVENNLRALEAYNEALKVRTAKDTPVEYANTIANKANILFNLPDDVENPEAGNPNHLKTAKTLYEEAQLIFTQYGESERAEMVGQALQDLDVELQALSSVN